MAKKDMKHFLYRLFYLIIVIVIIVFLDNYFAKLEQEFYRFELSYYRYYILRLISFILLGIILGLPQFIAEYQKWGSWNYDSFKLISLGLPLLLIRVVPLIQLPTSNLPNWLVKLYMYLFIGSPTLNVLSGVALGYILVTAFSKKSYYV